MQQEQIKKKKVKILRIWPKIYLDWHHRIHELTLTSGDKTLTTMAKVTMMIMTHDSQITLEKKKLKNVYILIKMAFFGFAITRQQDRYEYGFNQPTLNTREQDK